MTDRLRLAFAQLNPTVGDIRGNLDRIRQARAAARQASCDMLVCPELALSGYPPEDLVLKPFFLDLIERSVADLAAETGDGGPAVLSAAPWRAEGRVHNAVQLLEDGRLRTVRFKHHLPNYGVFDEARVFAAGPHPGPIAFRGVRLGVMICEDMWFPDVAETLAESGAELLVVPNGSPWEAGKPDQRLAHATGRIRETGLALAYLNQVGGQDELVFDGASFVLNPDCSVAAASPSFREDLLVTDWERGPEGWTCRTQPAAAPPEGAEAIWQALVLGLRDYVRKNHFPGVLIGLSGGIDSALSAAIAVDALGPDRVWCVMMPSPYTSEESLEDAADCARRLGLRFDTIAIGPAMAAYGAMLAPLFAGRPADITEENIQSRARGMTLMALSNKFGHMVLSTGNKSEMSVGYATLYGDMCGGFNVLKDVYKTTVWQLARWRNQMAPADALGPPWRVIPERIITKAPSAELKPNQTDQDSLPPYEALDDILFCLVEREMGVAEITGRGHDVETVARVWRLLDRAEYKRRQAPPGVKISPRAFGRERRYPITNSFVDLIRS